MKIPMFKPVTVLPVGTGVIEVSLGMKGKNKFQTWSPVKTQASASKLSCVGTSLIEQVACCSYHFAFSHCSTPFGNLLSHTVLWST